MAVTATDSTPAAPSPSPSAPAETTPASTGETPQATPTGADATAETPKTVDIPDDLIRQRIAEYDPRELARLNRKYANHVGNEADRLADKRVDERISAARADWERDYRNRQEAAELRELRDTNPELYVQREKELEAKLARQQEENTRIKSRVDTEVLAAREQSDALLREWATSLPEPVQQKLREMGQIDEGEWAASRRKFQQVATDLYRDHLRESVVTDEVSKEVAKKLELELAKRSKDLEAGVKAAAAAESNASDPAPDTGGGTAGGSGPMTQAEFDAIRHDQTQRRAAKDRVLAGVAAGLILR